MTAQTVIDALLAMAQPERAVLTARFFKTGPGQYGEGDQFLGLTMPEQREIARQFIRLPMEEVEKLLQNPYHECRMTGLVIWVLQCRSKGIDASDRKAIFDRYLANRHNINNWDLVDVTCPTVVGSYLLNNDRSVLYDLADENHLWSQRIAIVSTLTLVRKGQFADTFAISEKLMAHRHDLIHKAIGWMLREVGKKNEDALEEFLHDHIRQLPRTSLRYAIERFSPEKRKAYLTM
jgi:3-methyladenine DNA glycosylase AlkD